MGKFLNLEIILILLLIIFFPLQNSGLSTQNSYFIQFSENETFAFPSAVDAVKEYGFVIPSGYGFYFIPDDYLKQPYFYELETGNTFLISKTTSFTNFPLLLDDGTLLFLELILQPADQTIRLKNYKGSILFEGEFKIVNRLSSLRIYTEPGNDAYYLQLYDNQNQFFGLIYFNLAQNELHYNFIEFTPKLEHDFIGRFFHYNNELYYFHSTSNSRIAQISKPINGSLQPVLDVDVKPEFYDYTYIQEILVVNDKLVINTVTASNNWLFSIDSINLMGVSNGIKTNTTLKNLFSTNVNHSPCEQSINGRCTYFTSPVFYNSTYYWTLPSSVVYTQDFANFNHNKIEFNITENNIPVGTIWNIKGQPGFVTYSSGYNSTQYPPIYANNTITQSDIYTTISDNEPTISIEVPTSVTQTPSETIFSTRPSDVSAEPSSFSLLNFNSLSILGVLIIPVVNSFRKYRKK